MTVCKYMSSHWGLDYLSNWRLKITPPADFNDPFELKPPAPEIFTSEYFEEQFEENVERLATDELAKKLMELSNNLLPHDLSLQMAMAFIDGTESLTYKRLVKKLTKKYPRFSERELREKAKIGHAVWPQLLEHARQGHRNIRVPANAFFQQALQERIPSMLGVLCLSKNLNQPLMWSHYAESHRGLMIEFDSAHAALDRRRTEKDEFGFLRDVHYSERRPTLNVEALNEDRGFQVFALTKSNHWAYEEEQRFIWPLEQCEKTPNGQVCLIDIPSSAVVSVTLGCKATTETETGLIQSLAKQDGCSHIQVRRARMHATEFELVYEST